MDSEQTQTGNVQQIFGVAQSTPVTDELRKLACALKPHCPCDTIITFEFEEKLRLHVDLRRFEDMTTIEALLPTICGGIFGNVRRGNAVGHPFFHRVSAIITR